MRLAVLLLVLANLALLVYTRLDGVAAGEGARLAEQVDAERIKVLTPQQVASLGPAKMAALVDVCAEWGPLSDAERVKAMADLDALQLGKLLTQRKVDVDSGFWVTVGPFASRGGAEKRVGELRNQGVTDMSAVDAGRGQYVVSLGVFRTEAAARARADVLARQGVTTAKVEPRQQPFPQTMLVVRDPQQPAVARLKDLQPQYPGSDLRFGACPAAS